MTIYKALLLLSIMFPVLANDNSTVHISNFCELINERRYFTQRLEKTIAFFQLLYKQAPQIPIDISSFHSEQHAINDVAIQIKNIDSLDLVFDIWQNIKIYKKINDSEFTKEFTRLILAIQKHLTTSLLHTKNITEHPDEEIILALEDSTFTDATTLRYYYSTRLNQALSYLKTIPCSKENMFEVTNAGCNCVFVSEFNFQHKTIQQCIQAMELSNNLEPVIKLSHDFETFKLIQDELFLKEFLLLVFTIYRNLIINHAPPIITSTKTIINKKHTYKNIHDLPLEEILDAIDILSEELPVILEKYELNSNMKWGKWFKKYWWVPPITIASISIRIYLAIHKKNPIGDTLQDFFTPEPDSDKRPPKPDHRKKSKPHSKVQDHE